MKKYSQNDRYVIECETCGIALTESLKPLNNWKEQSFEDGKPLLAPGYFFPSDGDQFTNTEGLLLVSPESTINLINHSEISRLSGCCGPAGCDGINQLCVNGHEVATLHFDCWRPHAVCFCSDGTRARTLNNNSIGEE